MNDKLKLAIDEFLKDYINEDYFLGALLTGSYASGNQNVNSDIDLYIVTKDDIDWRERGNKLVNGFLVEYFINPIKKIREYMENELKTYHISTTRLFAGGKILIDKTGIVGTLVKEAQNNLSKDFCELDDFAYKMNCYGVWDGFDELEEKYKRKKDIDFSYYIFIERIINAYFQNSKFASVPLNKIEYILNDEEYRRNYNITRFADEEFSKLLTECLNEKDYDKKFMCAKRIYNYFLNKFKDFDINNFMLRSKVE
jgi:hypothetical protein